MKKTNHKISRDPVGVWTQIQQQQITLYFKIDVESCRTWISTVFLDSEINPHNAYEFNTNISM